MKRFLVLSALIALLAAPAALACDKQGSMTASAGHACPGSMKNVERTVTNLDNGARIEMNSTDPAVVSTLQTHMAADTKSAGCCKDCPMGNTAWTHKVENTDNGVVLFLTADSKDEIGKIQTAAAGMAKGGCSKQAGGKGECPHRAKSKGDDKA